MGSVVQSPDGRTWTVQRRWVPRLGSETVWGRFHRRFRQTFRRTTDLADVDPGCLDVIGEGIVAAIVIVVVVLAVVFIGIPLVVAVIDLALVLILAVLGVLARVVLRRPWIVEARADDGSTATWRVVGWRTSGERVTEVRELLRSGIDPPTDA